MPVFFPGMPYILFIGYMSMHLVLRIYLIPTFRLVYIGVIFFLSRELMITWYYRMYFIYVWVCLFLCSAHIELGHYKVKYTEAERLI